MISIVSKGLNMSEEKKKIEVIDGDGSTLKISTVYNYIKDVKPKGRKNDKKIIVPDEKKILMNKKNSKNKK